MRTLRALKFLFIGPMIVAMLAVINVMTSPGEWWVQWPALGIGIAWVISLFRVATAVVLMGGLAAFVAYVTNRSRSTA
ncbi:MAG: 2TM domain-containing protein [Acidobacteriota bacterium]|nr:2TM domain-containing protein [Acidobacteriota bacterium]